MVKKSKVPLHVAIIPDGNRRWAKEKGMISTDGHRKASSYEHIKELFDEAKILGVKYLSFWGFSTENWTRDKKEIDEIFKLVKDAIIRWEKEAHKNKIRFIHIGRKDRLPRELVSDFEKLEEMTKNYNDFNVLICLDYGGRDEIIRAVNRILADKKTKISEEEFMNYLDTKGIPEPDLIIRTGKERRLSGFMPFQSVYSELYFSDVYFPDFDACELREAISEYLKRERRFGK
ncbi:MAG: polyprenyl diphosphate synthase [Candidatus Pacearchaeota archaeon]|nr:polyprenyl diphosphate synthase [Candidatus Pacearchaeota archaeon]